MVTVFQIFPRPDSPQKNQEPLPLLPVMSAIIAVRPNTPEFFFQRKSVLYAKEKEQEKTGNPYPPSPPARSLHGRSRSHHCPTLYQKRGVSAPDWNKSQDLPGLYLAGRCRSCDPHHCISPERSSHKRERDGPAAAARSTAFTYGKTVFNSTADRCRRMVFILNPVVRSPSLLVFRQDRMVRRLPDDHHPDLLHHLVFSLF